MGCLLFRLVRFSSWCERWVLWLIVCCSVVVVVVWELVLFVCISVCVWVVMMVSGVCSLWVVLCMKVCL